MQKRPGGRPSRADHSAFLLGWVWMALWVVHYVRLVGGSYLGCKTNDDMRIEERITGCNGKQYNQTPPQFMAVKDEYIACEMPYGVFHSWDMLEVPSSKHTKTLQTCRSVFRLETMAFPHLLVCSPRVEGLTLMNCWNLWTYSA